MKTLRIDGVDYELSPDGRGIKRTADWQESVTNAIASLQTGEVSSGFVTPEQYGAVGTGLVDDAAAIRLAHAASLTQKLPLKFSAKTYRIDTPIDLGLTNHFNWQGTAYIAGSKTTIRAGASMRWLVAAGITGQMSNIDFDGNGLATYCLLFKGCALSSFTDLFVTGSLRDGILDVSHALPEIIIPAAMMTRTGSTVTCYGKHDYVAGDLISMVNEATPVNYPDEANFPAGNFTVTAVTSTSFSYTQAGAATVSTLPHKFRGQTYSNNSRNTFYNFTSNGCGRAWITSGIDAEYRAYYLHARQITNPASGSVASTSGNADLTFTNLDVSVLGLRRGDPIRVGTGGNERHYIVHQVKSSTQITVKPTPDVTAASQQFAIGCGSAYREERHGDNNINHFYGGSHRLNAGYAFEFDGLYGPTVYDQQIDYQPFAAYRVGGVGGNPVIGCQITGDYLEAIQDRPYYLVSASDIRIMPSQDLHWTGAEANTRGGVRYMTGIPGDNVGSYISRDGMWAIGTGDAFTIVAPVTTLQDASANLTFKYQVAEMTAPAATFAWTTNFIILDPGGSNRSIDYPCRVSSDRGRIVQVMCKVGQANTFTLRDEADLAGSKLKLRAATRVLDAGDQITLVCDGTYWWEAAFSG